ncbi:MAG: hypothetical protein GX181_05015 [Synergistaceae bacterium]|nr:hypothetical protein [Synergistaceae bacterium]
MKKPTLSPTTTSGFFDRYISILDFFAEVCGPDCELVLHDLSCPEASIIAIRNGHISGRTEGGTMSEYAPSFVRLVRSGGYTRNMVSHVDRIGDGRIIKSHAFFIKDEEGELRGMICANHDVTNLVKLHDFLHDRFQFIRGMRPAPEEEGVAVESLLEPDASSGSDYDIEDLMDVIIEQGIAEFTVSPAEMGPKERMRFVGMLNDRHLFSLKGSVARTAERLGISEATVYRYLKRENLRQL